MNLGRQAPGSTAIGLNNPQMQGRFHKRKTSAHHNCRKPPRMDTPHRPTPQIEPSSCHIPPPPSALPLICNPPQYVIPGSFFSFTCPQCHLAPSEPSIALAFISRNQAGLPLVPPCSAPLPPLAILGPLPYLPPPFASLPLSGILLQPTSLAIIPPLTASLQPSAPPLSPCPSCILNLGGSFPCPPHPLLLLPTSY
ncbi:hypothetical protein AMTR_s00102p00066040 [Amborella trichopoda]|uniref:Uncharacterized protein n=1 Tax=Amborella trichopoda TaxID=13333 RepID=W1P0Q0_AMBTC|nr:hypothetical protein AMTR_s00102p00066040 [Amborella trichopoda]